MAVKQLNWSYDSDNMADSATVRLNFIHRFMNVASFLMVVKCFKANLVGLPTRN